MSRSTKSFRHTIRTVRLARVATLCAATLLLISWAGQHAVAETPYDTGVKLFKEGKFALALASFAAAEAGGKRDANIYYYEALCSHQLRDYVKARQRYEYILAKFPTSDAAILARQALGQHDQRPEVTVQASDNEEPETTTIPFSRYPTGSHIFVKVLVNGEPVTVMLDTGASVTVFPQSVLDKNGIKTKSIKNAVRMEGVGGETSAAATRLNIQFGEINQMIAAVIQDDAIKGSASDYPLLGQSFLCYFNYEINYRSNTVKLTRIKPSAASANAPKKAVATSSRDPNVVPFTRDGGNLSVVVKVNGRECDMIFDTGAANINFSDKSISGLGLNVPVNSRRQNSMGVGGSREGYGFVLDEVQFGPIVRHHVRASMATYSGINKPLLGYSFLEGTVFTVDNEKRVIRFSE